MDEHVEQPPVMGAGTPALWAGVLGLPVLWAVQFQLRYSLVPWVCVHHKMWVLHLTTLVSLGLGAILLQITWSDYRRSHRPQSESFETGPHSRARFLGALGLLMAVMFLLGIAAQGIPSLFIDPCSD